MTGLDLNSAYSVWFLIFNRPEHCTHPNGAGGACTPGPDGDPIDAVLNVAGFVTGMDGVANFTGGLDVGRAPDGLAIFGKLTGAKGAEIHVILESHGAPLSGHVAEQMSIPAVSCNSGCVDQFGFVFPSAKLAHDHD